MKRSIDIGARIKFAIENSGKTAKAVCEKMDLTVGAIQKIYNKKHINTDLLLRFSQILNRPVSWFLEEDISTTEKNISNEPVISYGELNRCKEELLRLQGIINEKNDEIIKLLRQPQNS